MSKKKRRTKEEIAQLKLTIEQGLKAGKSYQEIARELNISGDYCRYVVPQKKQNQKVESHTDKMAQEPITITYESNDRKYQVMILTLSMAEIKELLS